MILETCPYRTKNIEQIPHFRRGKLFIFDLDEFFEGNRIIMIERCKSACWSTNSTTVDECFGQKKMFGTLFLTKRSDLLFPHFTILLVRNRRTIFQEIYPFVRPEEKIILFHEFGLCLIYASITFIPHYNDNNNCKYFKKEKIQNKLKMCTKGC